MADKKRENLKLVAVRMTPTLHKRAMKEATLEKVTFGQFVRDAVDRHIVYRENVRLLVGNVLRAQGRRRQ